MKMPGRVGEAAMYACGCWAADADPSLGRWGTCFSCLPLPIMQFLFTFAYHAFPVYLCLSCISCLPLPLMHFLCAFAYHASPVYLCLSCISCSPLPIMHFLFAFAFDAFPGYLCLSCISCLPLPIMHFLFAFAYHAFPVCLCLSCISCSPLPIMHFQVGGLAHSLTVFKGILTSAMCCLRSVQWCTRCLECAAGECSCHTLTVHKSVHNIRSNISY